MEEEIKMMKDKEQKQVLEEKLKQLENMKDELDNWPYYSEEKLEQVSKQDIFSAGVLVLECVQNIQQIKKKFKLKKEDLEDILEICAENYSNYFNILISNMIEFDPNKRWDLEKIQDYLEDIYSDEKENITQSPDQDN